MVKDKDDFELIRHPKLRLKTPLSKPDQYTNEPSNYATPLYQWLYTNSDSPNPLALYLFSIYLLAFNKLLLLLFFNKADSYKLFEPKTL
jgi:hypothetical protein